MPTKLTIDDLLELEAVLAEAKQTKAILAKKVPAKALTPWQAIECELQWSKDLKGLKAIYRDGNKLGRRKRKEIYERSI